MRPFGAEHPGVELQAPLRTGDAAARTGIAFLPDGTAADPADVTDKTDIVCWFIAPNGGAGAAGRLAVRVRTVGLTGQVSVDGPRPQNATLGAWLAAGEPGLGSD